MAFTFSFPFLFPDPLPGEIGEAPTSLLRRAVVRRGLVAAIVDAALGVVDEIAGRAVTRLSYPLAANEVDVLGVESVLGFGTPVDGTARARFLIDGEIIEADTRSEVVPFGFAVLTRGVDGTPIKAHAAGAIVVDLSENTSAIDHLRRSFFVDTAIGADLDVIGRNHGLAKCPGLSEDQWRRIVKVLSYAPRQGIAAFELVLEAYYGDTTSWSVSERPDTDPWTTFVSGAMPFDNSPVGKFYLNGGETALTDGLTQVTVTWPVGPAVDGVLGVYPDTIHTRRGARSGPGITDYFVAGSYTPGSPVITLGSSPGAIGTSVIVDYCVGETQHHHYLATDETVRADPDDPWAYLSDPLAAVVCLLNKVRAAGTVVSLSTRA